MLTGYIATAVDNVQKLHSSKVHVPLTDITLRDMQLRIKKREVGQLLRDICVAGDQSDVLPLASTLTINSAMNAPSVPLTDAGMVRKIMTFVGLLQSNGPLAADGSAQIPRLETIVVTEVPSLFRYWGKIFHNIMGSLAAHLGWAYKCCQSGDFESFFCAAPLAYVNLCSFAAISTFTTAQFERIPIESAWSLPFGELGLLALTDTQQETRHQEVIEAIPATLSQHQLNVQNHAGAASASSFGAAGGGFGASATGTSSAPSFGAGTAPAATTAAPAAAPPAASTGGGFSLGGTAPAAGGFSLGGAASAARYK